MSKIAFEYIKKVYRVPAEYGRRIVHEGDPGIILEDRGNYLGVNFDKDPPGHVVNIHPTHEVTYLGIGKPRQTSRSQQRYQDWLDSGRSLSFGDWLKSHTLQRRSYDDLDMEDWP